nr:ABC transporter substrate-binding protein [uncultured Caproiciproducens sp.]
MLTEKNHRKHIVASVLCLSLIIGVLTSCNQMNPSQVSSSTEAGDASVKSTAFTDAIGNKVEATSAKRVIALMGSFAETWLNAGGTLVGVTSDAYTGHQMNLSKDVVNLGLYTNPSMEKIISLKPDFIILSADTTEHVKLCKTLRQAGLNAACFKVNTFGDYLKMLQICTQITGRNDLYEKNGTVIEKQIDTVIAGANGKKSPSVLFVRAYSSGYKALNSSSMTGVMLKDLGATNIADNDRNLLDNLSMDAIIERDPDYILVVTMGSNEKKALALIDQQLKSNPAWAGLKAVKNNKYYVIPRDLFHYKPNARWGESYEYLSKLLYGD